MLQIFFMIGISWTVSLIITINQVKIINDIWRRNVVFIVIA